MCHFGFRPAETVGRPIGIVAFVPGVADQDQQAADIAGRKLGVTAAAIVERLSGCAGEPLARVDARRCRVQTCLGVAC
jgi:hypothetical protein